MGTCCCACFLGDCSNVADKMNNNRESREQLLATTTKTTVMADSPEDTGRPNSETCVNALSSTIVCSSTTADDAPVGCSVHHGRVETAAASTIWPDVSGPTASTRPDYPPCFSDVDSDGNLSLPERSTSTLHERYFSWMTREREIMWKERERRRVILHSALSAYYDVVLSHHKNLLAIERRRMILEFIAERHAVFLRAVGEQESTSRRRIECEWRLVLLAKMQKYRVECCEAGGSSAELTFDLSTARVSDKTTWGAPARHAQRGRCFSAPSEYMSGQVPQRRQQQAVSLLPSASPSRRQSLSFRSC